ncbi:hypothetical protein X975_09787, partial [Stegodyphus mimosarum]
MSKTNLHEDNFSSKTFTVHALKKKPFSRKPSRSTSRYSHFVFRVHNSNNKLLDT